MSFTGTFNTVDNLKIWKNSGNYVTGEGIDTNAREAAYGGAESYVQPTQTTSVIATEIMPVAEPSGPNLGIGGSLGGQLTRLSCNSVTNHRINSSWRCEPETIHLSMGRNLSPSNLISIQWNKSFNRRSNSMLNFYWKAVLKSGEEISQFDSEGKEVSFGLIQEQDKLKNIQSLALVCVEDNLSHLAVNLQTGEFLIRGGYFHPYNALSPYYEDLHYRIIFYRRKRQHAGTGGVLIGKPYIYRFLLGWQVTYKGLNYQRIIFYDPQAGSIEIKAKR